MGRHTVKSVLWKGHLKRLRLNPGDQWITLPRSACVTRGDQVELRGGAAYVLCENGRAQIYPPYARLETLTLGGSTLEVLAKEVTEPAEQEACDALSDFHYRGHVRHGRISRVILRSPHPSYPMILGYIELATPFQMNKARADVLDTTFALGDTRWEGWNAKTTRRHLHVVVRIARTVVHPELRGLGLAQLLVRHACSFARERWQSGGSLPLFLEISADMLRYVPFAESAGMQFVGYTEGNLHRVARDMEYLMRRFGSHRRGQIEFEEACGICDQQVARKDRALAIMRRMGLDRDDFIEKLRNVTSNSPISDLRELAGVLSFPKPHYMIGITPAAEDFLANRLQAMTLPEPPTRQQLAPTQPSGPISLRALSVSYVTRIRKTRSNHAIQQAFGIRPDDLVSTVIKDLSLEIPPGHVLLIVGASGSGKTTLVRILARQARANSSTRIAGELKFPHGARIGRFAPPAGSRSLIDEVGRGDVEKGLYLLGLAGLSEAYLYLKPFAHLSAGQQYRAMLAMLLAQNKSIWILDEFCTNLDPVTAAVVAENVGKLARRVGATVIAATPDASGFMHALQPDTVLNLRSVTRHRVLSGADYAAEATQAGKRNRLPRIGVSSGLIRRVRRGQPAAILSINSVALASSHAVLQAGTAFVLARVLGTDALNVSDVSAADAHAAGYRTRADCLTDLLNGSKRLREQDQLSRLHLAPLVESEYAR